MHYLDLTLPTLAENLALDEALLLQAEDGGPEVLRFWQWRERAVVLGAGGVLHDDVDVVRCRADGVPIARRSSGGGTVLLDDGCVMYSLVLAYERDPALAQLLSSYGYILRPQCEAMRALGIDAIIQGSSDVAIGERKVAGSAQQRKRSHLLHHGTLLDGCDTEAMARYLKLPPRQPEYRRRRAHAQFVTSLGVGNDKLKQMLMAAYQADEPMISWPQALVSRLTEEKFAQGAWIERR